MRTAWGATISICCAALGCASTAPVSVPVPAPAERPTEAPAQVAAPLPATRLADDSMDPTFALDPPKESVDKEFHGDPPPRIDPDFVMPERVRPAPGEGVVVIPGASQDETEVLLALAREAGGLVELLKILRAAEESEEGRERFRKLLEQARKRKK